MLPRQRTKGGTSKLSRGDMSSLVIGIVAILHVLGVVLFVILRFHRLGWRKEYLIPILCVPVFGPVMAFTIDLLHVLNHPGTRPVELEALKLEENVYWNAIEEPQDDPSVIPLEEAILINDKLTRRQVVLDTFRHDAAGYLDVLLLARGDEDTDTTHYATIRITKIHRRFQLALQECAVQHEADPLDTMVLEKYLRLLEEYIASPLPDELMLRRQKAVYAGLLDEKLALTPNDHSTVLRKLRYCIANKEDIAGARALADQLQQNWPEDEQTWIESLRLCVERHDRGSLELTLSRMRAAPVSWTRQGREAVAPWLPIEEKIPA
jgi:hypothetical protein